jgi:hypothetical protein
MIPLSPIPLSKFQPALEILAMGLARPAAGKYKRVTGDFLSWGRGLKVRASDPFPKQNKEPF